MPFHKYLYGSLGISGYSGFSGVSGYSGPAGGATGSSGFSGYSGISGLSGSSGISGFSGISGLSGQQGSQGIFGGDSHPYLFRTATSGDPSSAGLLFNNSTLSSATQITINQYNLDLILISAWLAAMGTSSSNPRGVIRIFKKDDSSIFADFYVVPGLVAVPPGNTGYAVQYITGNGTFTDLENIVLTWTRAGDQGSSGYSGISGFSGSGGGGTSGYSGYSGATGAGTSGFSGYSGPSGFSGYSGPSGFSGMFGGDSQPYTANTAVIATSVSGEIESDGTPFSSATSLVINTINADSVSVASWLLALDDSTNGIKGFLRVVKIGDSSVFVDYSITSLIDHTGDADHHIILNVTPVTSNGTISTNDKVIVTFSRAGDSGYSGISGFSGYSGPSGFSGYSGSTGTSGFSGYSGSTGTSGFSGYSGINGLNGVAGTSGFSGYSGPSGFSGYSGKSGFSGYSGISGFSGYSGKSGFSGYSGPSGFSGYSGPTGTSGFSGYSGPSGFSGYSGPSGFSGYSGKSGFSGYSGGTSGFSGYSGATGSSVVYWPYTTADVTTTSSTTYASVSDIVSPTIAANENWNFEYILDLTSSDFSGGGFKFRLQLPTSATAAYFYASVETTNTVASGPSFTTGGSTTTIVSDTVSFSLAPTTINNYLTTWNGVFGANDTITAIRVIIKCTLKNGANSGTVNLQTAQITSSATSFTVKAGSTMKCMKATGTGAGA